MTKVSVGLVASAALALTAVGCASSTYRIPGAEMQRLAYLNAESRGDLVRVVPPDESTTHLAAVSETQPVAPPEPSPSTAPTDPDERQAVAANDQPDVDADAVPAFSGNIAIDVSGSAVGGRPRRAAPSVVMRDAAVPRPRVAPSFSPPVFTPVVRAPPVHAAVSPTPRPTLGATAGRSVPTGGTRIPAPPLRTGGGRAGGGHSGGGHSGGGALSGGDGLVALLAVVAIIGIVVLIAEAASEEAQPFDGWAQIPPDQPLHLRYPDSERVVRLRDLRPTDLIGLRDTIVDGKEGPLVRLPPDADRTPRRSRVPPQDTTRSAD